MDEEGRNRRACFRVIVRWCLIKTIERVTFRLKDFTAIALIRSIKLSNNNQHKQGPLANGNSNDLLRVSLLPQLYDLGKADLELHFVLDFRSHLLRHDEVLLNRSGFRTIHYQRPYYNAQFHLEWPSFHHLRLSIWAKSKNTFLDETLFDVTTHPPPQSDFF